MLRKYLSSSIGKKQIVAVTGLWLILFLCFHLTLNMLIFLGPEAYNFFPEKAKETGLLLRFIEMGLASVFLIHIFFTFLVVIENFKASSNGYAVQNSWTDRSLATRLMPYTGTIILIFLLIHVCDFVIFHHNIDVSIYGPGMYGVVKYRLSQPLWAIGYMVVMFAVGSHLAHAIQSVFQSFGFYHSYYTPLIRKVSTVIGITFAVLFCMIPITFCWGLL